MSGNCTGNYSVTARTCSGSDGSAYTTISTGIGAAATGDTINIRSGTYSVNSSTNVNFSSDTLTTTIQAYNSESVTIANTTVVSATFSLGSSAKNILIKDLHFTGTSYLVITGWVNYSGNVWTASILESTAGSQIRFNSTNGTNAGSIVAVDSANKYYVLGTTIYAYSVGNPTTIYTSPGIILANGFNGIGIGNSSINAAGNLITVDNCTFENFSHAGIKGTWRWHVLNSKFMNIGTDGLDHDIYANGVQTPGNEMIFEYNYFGYSPGAGIHFYTAPAYAIVRYNVFNGLSGSNRGAYGILLAGSHHTIYNNTFYGYSTLGGINLYNGTTQNNIIKNNIFSNNTSDLGVSNIGSDNTVETNYFGSSIKCTGCNDYSGSGGQNLSALADAPPNTYSSSPWTQFTYNFTKSVSGNTYLTFFNACGGGASPTTGIWYLDDISLVPVGGGAELVQNGGMEGTFTNGIAPHWATCGSNCSKESTVVHSGLSSQKINLPGGCGAKLEGNDYIYLTAGDYTLTGWAKRDTGTGTLPVYVNAVGNSSSTIGVFGPSFLGTLPYSSSTDFKIDPTGTDFSLVTDTGQNLGSTYRLGLNSSSTSWPLTTIDQNFYGTGWDLGAFVYNTHPSASSISSVASNVTNLQSLITWITDENATSQVDYGTSTSYGSTTAKADTTSGVISHSVTLSNLTGCSTYHYRVRSTDGAQNETISSDNSFSITDGCPASLVCSNPQPESVPWLYQATSNKNSVILNFTNWATSVDHFALEYGTSSNNYQFGSNNIGGNGSTSYTVNSLNPNTTYYFRVRAGNGCATGTWSNEISAKTLGLAPTNNLNIVSSNLESVPNQTTVKNPTTSKETNIPNVQGYLLNVKVKDTKGNTVEGAEVTIHSTPQTKKTDQDGVASFSNVEAGQHQVLIAYAGYSGEQSINLTGDVKEFNLNITIEAKNAFLSPKVLVVIGALVLIIGFLVFKLIKKNKIKKLL